jgi:divalent metal cation (Fe/Co/Zn/Cd) transporter
VTVPKKFNLEDKIVEDEIRTVLEKYPEIKKIGRIVSLNFENILKIDIDCSFDKELSIEKVHDLTSKMEHIIRTQVKNAVITIHPEPD